MLRGHTHTFAHTHAHTHRCHMSCRTHQWVTFTYECVMSRTNVACRLHQPLSHAAYTNLSRMPPTPTSLACRLHQPLSHAANTNDSLARSLTNHSCYAHECVMSHMNESRHRTAAAPPCMSHAHIWLRHVTLMLKSCPTYEWVMSHIWMSHVTHLNESCHTSEWTLMLKSMFLSHI